ncbi:MAG: hypothetical protein QW175_06660 [Candidatus Bathyarchaeia archaeon]
MVILVFLSTLMLAAASTITAKAEEASANAKIWTDKPDYAPEETVTIYGAGFLPDSAILIQVTRPDYTADSWSTTSNSSGNFVTTHQLEEY